MDDSTIPRVLIYAGIDEAGYGPMLGPLCVACTVFVVHDHDADTGPCDLWRRLGKAVCRKKADRLRRIAVDDSKKLKLPNHAAAHPLKFLERGVLSFLLAGEGELNGQWCEDDQQLYARLGIECDGRDWYRSSTILPLAHSTDELRIAANRLSHAMRDNGVRLAMTRCEAIDAGAFNQQVQRMGSKASVNFCAMLRHVDAVWRRWPIEHPRVIVDRLGGRVHYLQDLLHAWPDAQIQVLAETETLSRYRLDRGGSLLTISFMVESESQHLPTALASMTAKYTRELLMLRLNRYFAAHMPELKPTAGYVEDARRYLAEIEPLLTRLGVDRQTLIRSV